MTDLGIVARFGMTGVCSTLLHLGVVWLASNRFGAPLALANGLAFLVANGFSYLMQSRWTFKARPRSLQRWCVASAALLCLSVGVGRLADLARLPTSIAWIVVVVPMMGVSFLLMRYWVFPRVDGVAGSAP
ncbi:MAG: gtrA-like family protein [Rhodoferax sp.]|nr:gtrA-like family protein [Rhodoferax sp.]